MKSLVFETARFNLSRARQHFINPCCFGDDLAEWLEPRLEVQGVSVIDLYQEDWGWEMKCEVDDYVYFIGISGIPEREGSNFGQWRLLFTKQRSFIERLAGKNRLDRNEPIILLVKELIREVDTVGHFGFAVAS